MHKSAYAGKQPIQPSKRVAVIACMDARLDVEDLLGLQTGEVHVIRNAGGVVTEDAIRLVSSPPVASSSVSSCDRTLWV